MKWASHRRVIRDRSSFGRSFPRRPQYWNLLHTKAFSGIWTLRFFRRVLFETEIVESKVFFFWRLAFDTFCTERFLYVSAEHNHFNQRPKAKDGMSCVLYLLKHCHSCVSTTLLVLSFLIDTQCHKHAKAYNTLEQGLSNLMGPGTPYRGEHFPRTSP